MTRLLLKVFGFLFELILFSAIGLVLVGSISSIKVFMDLDELRGSIDSYSFYGVNISDLEPLNGIYFSEKGFYCVSTRGRSAEDIAGTDSHENCHVLVRGNWDHFCNNSR